jgi:broad specificity phosphatase PhoE
MTRIILIRHGETMWNRDRRIQGRTDVLLSSTGREQAQLLAERLAGIELAAIYSSDLKRAAATARAVAKRHNGLRVTLVEALRERNWGILEGKRWDEILKKHPDDINAIISGASAYRPEGGESKQDVLERAFAFFQTLPPKHQEKTIAVVSHGGLCSTLLKYVLGIDPSRMPPFFMDNCAITVLEHHGRDNSWFVRALNDTAHLEAGAQWKPAARDKTAKPRKSGKKNK